MGSAGGAHGKSLKERGRLRALIPTRAYIYIQEEDRCASRAKIGWGEWKERERLRAGEIKKCTEAKFTLLSDARGRRGCAFYLWDIGCSLSLAGDASFISAGGSIADQLRLYM